jgi:exportin-1
VFFEKSSNLEVIVANFVPPLLDPVLGDYHRNVASARDPQVLPLLTVMITLLKEQILDKVPKIFEAVFQVYTEFSWMSY